MKSQYYEGFIHISFFLYDKHELIICFRYRLQIHQWSERVVKNITRDKWVVRGGFMVRNIQMVVTPRVVKEVSIKIH